MSWMYKFLELYVTDGINANCCNELQQNNCFSLKFEKNKSQLYTRV